MKKDKARVEGEDWSDERVQTFLAVTPYDDSPRDWFRLLRAYQSMRLEDFERFITFYAEDGGDLNATDRSGERFVDYIATHRHGADYAAAMVAAGAAPVSADANA